MPNENITSQLKGLPMDTLIAAPLIATAEAQQKLSATAWDFYEKVAYENNGNGEKKLRVAEFTVDRPVVSDGGVTTVKQKISAPFIGLVPVPSLLVDRVDIDFQMEVTDSSVETNSSNVDASVEGSAHWFVFKASLNGKVSTTRESTRSTNQNAKYQIHVSASQQPPTEGLSKLMDIMACCVEPRNITDSTNNG